jgi:hypothetical protein
VNTLPDTNRAVFASYINSQRKRRWVVARYVRQFTEKSDYLGDGSDLDTSSHDLDEETGTYYLKEGWWEQMDNYIYCNQTPVIEGEVDIWLELPNDEEISSWMEIL